MQPNGKPRVLVPRPISSTIHKAASDSWKKSNKNAIQIEKSKIFNNNMKGGSLYLQDDLWRNTINK